MNKIEICIIVQLVRSYNFVQLQEKVIGNIIQILKCANCPQLTVNTKSQNKTKVVTRHIWEEHKERIRLNRLLKSGKILYKFRKEKEE